MSTTPPTPSSPPPSYPTALKVFTTFQDYTDIIWAVSINEIHAELGAIEAVLGVNPFYGTPYTTFSGGLLDLYNNKAPIIHNHDHNLLYNDAVGDVHTQYILTNGSRGFTHPVNGVAGSGNDLVPLSQLQSFGYINSGQATTLVNESLANLATGAVGGPALYGSAPASPNWQIRGGTFQGCSNASGIVGISLGSPGYTTCLQAFVCTKIPAASGQPCPPYNHIEAQLTLVGSSLDTANVQFSHDYSWQPYMWVAFNWVSIGV
jgi:hypothetical protein